MARSYPHIGEEQGIQVQTVHFLHQRIRELHELISKSSDEYDMWSALRQEHGDRIPPSAGGRIEKRMQKLAERIRTDRNEQEDLEELLAALEPCTNCNGLGSLRIFEYQDQTRSEPCPKCDGTGRAGT